VIDRQPALGYQIRTQVLQSWTKESNHVQAGFLSSPKLSEMVLAVSVRA